MIYSAILSPRAFLRLIGPAIAAMALLVACERPHENTKLESTPLKDTPRATPPSASCAQPPTKGVTSANLDVKIGQMLMVGFRGLEVDNEHVIVQDIRKRHLGGVVLFDYDVPLRSVGKPEDVADVIVFLASEQARWVTGQVLSVHGGHRMSLGR